MCFLTIKRCMEKLHKPHTLTALADHARYCITYKMKPVGTGRTITSVVSMAASDEDVLDAVWGMIHDANRLHDYRDAMRKRAMPLWHKLKESE